MGWIMDSIEEWFRDLLTSGIISNLTGLFDSVNQSVGNVALEAGTTPQAWNSSIYNMIRHISDSVILPVAGVILAFVATLELIQMLVDRNNLHEVDTWMFFKWMFKTACAILIVTNTWNIVMGVFELSQQLVQGAAGVIRSDLAIDISYMIESLETRLAELGVGELLGLWFQSVFVSTTAWILSACIFVIIYGRMIEIYLTTSLAPIPMATMANKEWGSLGQNYLRSLFALGFQGFMIIVCVAIYAVLVSNIAEVDDITSAIWTCLGYTVLLAFTLFKTGSLTKSIFNTH